MDGTRSFDLPVSDEWDVLSDLCNQMKKTMEKHKVIRDRTLLDFSRMTVRVIRSSKPVEKLPPAFAALSEQADHYWTYYARSESDIRLGFSYARVYQITRMIKVFQAECERERQLKSAMEEYKNYYQLLQHVYAAPGSSQEELRHALRLKYAALQQQTALLEAEGFLSSYQLGCQTHYTLPPAGISLYKRMGKLRTRAVHESWTFSADKEIVDRLQDTNWILYLPTLRSHMAPTILANNEVNNYVVSR